MTPTTIPAVLFAAARSWPTKTAILDCDAQFTFAQLRAKSTAAAGAMLATGLQPGERFSIWAPNIHEWVWVALGGLMAGGILVPLNTRYRGLEASDILRRSQSRLLFTTSGFLDTDYPALIADADLPELTEVVLLRGSNNDATHIDEFMARSNTQHEARAEQQAAAITPQDASDILYTSGTTGAPKGVVSSHGQTVKIFDTWSSTVGLREGDQYLIVNPFFHSFGYKAGWLSCLMKGATNLPMAVYNPEQTLALIEQRSISILPGAPTIFQTLLNSAELASSNTSSLRCAVTGAASVPEQLVHDMKNLLGFEEVFTAYGLTECPVVSITRPGDDIALIANTAGKAISATQIRVVDEGGTSVAPDEVGRIQVRGFNVMQGYFQNPQATAESIDADGWLETGDLGWMNANGYIKVTDRAKDMYITGGFNCYPAEIENLLLNHPSILDVAVTGIADERMGEVGQAYLVCSEAMQHSALTAWAREHMANFKVPRSFIRVDELPRNASGKVQKFLLAKIDGQLLG